jgi:hypothetical protein
MSRRLWKQNIPPTRPFIADPAATRRPTRHFFQFVPDQSFRHFLFFYLNKDIPQSHAWEHSCFCHVYGCPFHT